MSTAAATAQPTTVQPTIPLPFRHDTILGVCEALGEDFGVNANWLRIPISALVVYSPLLAFGTYFALGAVVLVSRLIAPNPKVMPAVAVAEEAPANSAAAELPIAA